MSFETVLKFIGWIMVGGPILAVMAISLYMIRGAANDDPQIMGLVMFGASTLFVGIALLALMYFTDLRMFLPK